MWTTLRADGKKGPFFIQTKSAKIFNMNIFEDDPSAHISYVPILKNSKTDKNIRPGERGMLTYLKYMIEEVNFLKAGDYLLFDGEKALYTPTVQEYLSRKKIFPFVIEPSRLHQFMNPCDNNFHSLFKMSYYRAISRQNVRFVSVAEKFRLARDCFDDIGENIVAQMFVKCGLFGDADKESTLIHLMFEGMGCLWKYDHFHRDNLIIYLEWCKKNNLHHLCSSITNSILKLSGLIK